MRLLIFAGFFALAACSAQQPEYTDQQRMCIAQRYREYDPKKLGPCVDVCTSCLSGTVATCNSSCKLKGAS
jgi:hypothetical protein